MLQLLQASPVKVCTYGLWTNCLAFADDVNIHSKTAFGMVSLLRLVEDWSTMVGMTFAPHKCILISAAANPAYQLYGQAISNEESSLYLGISVTQKGIDPVKSVSARLEKARKVISMLAEGGMNLGGFTPSASGNIFKSFIRPIYEYGMALLEWPAPQRDAIQKVQNMGLRCLFSASRTTSINAMHKLAQVPLARDRNTLLNARFFGQLQNNSNATIPAVNLFWKGMPKRNRNAKSLISRVQKNRLWSQLELKP
jgi:hypothetical protein